MRWLICDGIYPQALEYFRMKEPEFDGWDDHRRRRYLIHQSVGSCGGWERALSSLGHEAWTHIDGIGKWWDHCPFTPDAVIVQNVNRWTARNFFDIPMRIAFCSYASEIERLHDYTFVLSSFPWAPAEWSQLGISARYQPLAADPYVLEFIEQPKERDIEIVFIGGAGHRHIWNRGTKLLNAVAEEFPEELHWYGYRGPDVPPGLNDCWKGEAYGLDMYQLLARSKICLNRHGEIARKHGHNLRIFEAGLAGCFLVTECFEGLIPLTNGWHTDYTSVESLVSLITQLDFEADWTCKIWPGKLHDFVLENHTYYERAEELLSWL